MHKARERYESVAKVPCMHEKSRRLQGVYRSVAEVLRSSTAA
jgi:hypothetical protein